MGRKCKDLDSCKGHDDYERFAWQNGGVVYPGSNHDTVEGPTGGKAFLPRHKGDYPPGTNHDIRKQLRAILLIAAALAAIAILTPFL